MTITERAAEVDEERDLLAGSLRKSGSKIRHDFILDWRGKIYENPGGARAPSVENFHFFYYDVFKLKLELLRPNQTYRSSGLSLLFQKV